MPLLFHPLALKSLYFVEHIQFQVYQEDTCGNDVDAKVNIPEVHEKPEDVQKNDYFNYQKGQTSKQSANSIKTEKKSRS